MRPETGPGEYLGRDTCSPDDMFIGNKTTELMLLRLRAAHKEIELDEALRTGWGWRVPRMQLWVLEMLIAECEEDISAEAA